MTESIQQGVAQSPGCIVQMRYFAAVAEAAGVSEENVAVPARATAGTLRGQLSERHGGEFARILAVSALLANGMRLEDDDALNPSGGLGVDVLPPFAGG